MSVKAANEPVKPKVGDIYQEKAITTDWNGAKYHKEYRIVSIKPSKKDKTIPELIKLAVIVFHKWIKKRDSYNGWFWCISCNELKPVSEMQCGHYMPSTYSYLRFDEYNCNGECVTCNCHDPNHLIGYRKNLINKIGRIEVEQLEIDAHKPHKWDRQELLDIIKKYK